MFPTRNTRRPQAASGFTTRSTEGATCVRSDATIASASRLERGAHRSNLARRDRPPSNPGPDYPEIGSGLGSGEQVILSAMSRAYGEVSS